MMGIGRTPWNFDIVSYTQTGSPNECFPGLVNFVPAVAYHFCLNMPRAVSQPGKHSFGNPCIDMPRILLSYHSACPIFVILRAGASSSLGKRSSPQRLPVLPLPL